MKGKFTTKTIIVTAITLILAIVAVTGTVLFLKDSGEAKAIDKTETNLILPVAGNDEINSEEITQTEASEIVENVEAEEVTTDTQSGANTDEIGDAETETIETDDTTGATNVGTASQTRDELVEQIEETVVTEEKQILDELSLSWTTIELPSITSNMGVYKPELTIEKTATLVNGEPIIATTRVRPQDKITYEIKVSNIGNYKTTNVVITDSLDVIYEEQKIEAGNQILKLDVLASGKQATITVIYEVTENDVATLEKILNVAYATDGRTTVQDDDDTPVINPNVELTGEKTWEDAGNKYGTRPEKITVNLLADSEVVDSIEVIADENGIWNYEFIKLPMYSKDGKVITYTIDEESVRNYTKNIDEYNIANTLTPEETVDVLVTKTWVDNDNKYNTRPSEITVNLLADGNIVETVKITADENGIWEYEFTNLPKHNGKGLEIEYTISEEEVADYKEEINELNKYNIINTLEPEETVDVTGEKTWEDNKNQYSSRPSKIIVNLLIEGKVVNSKEVTADSNDDWKYEFTKLPKYAVNDKEIQDSIDEETVAYYNKKIEKYNITNTLEQEYITLRGTKEWVYPAGEASITVPTVEIVLLQNGEPYFADSKFNAKVNKDSTGYIYPNLPKYSFTTDGNGKIQREENSYSVKENQLNGWQKPIIAPIEKDGNVWTQNITNVANPINISFDVEKVWVDEGGKRPSITVKLYQNGNPYKKADGTEYSKTLNSGEKKYTFTNLPKYTSTKLSDGTITYQKNTYTVREVGTASGYEKPSYKDTETKTTITNKIKQDTVSISGTKVWNTPSKTNTANATSIEIYAYRKEANGKETKTKYFDKLEYGETTYKITDLPKYKENSDGTLYINSAGKVELNQYVAHEDKNSQYISSENGNKITNIPRGIVETITTEVTAESKTKLVDVVFVLDVSNSMETDGDGRRITKMRDAVNTTISTIMNTNPNNRVGIVAFTSNGEKTKAKPIQNLLSTASKIEYDSEYKEGGDKKGILYVCKCNSDKCSCTLNHKNLNGLSIQGATYTQTGIELGAEMLYNDSSLNKTNRTAIMILVTDGLPTVYNSNYTNILNDNLVSNNYGWVNGSEGSSADNGKCVTTNVNCILYTLRTANYWKSLIDDKYDTAKIFTLGIGLDTQTNRTAALATLKPTKENIRNYSQDLVTKLINAGFDLNNNPNAANYADKAFLTNDTIDEKELSKELNGFVFRYKDINTKTMFDNEEISTNTVELMNVDTSKENESTITYGTTSYTLKTAPEDAINKNGTTYTIYLNKLPNLSDDTQVYIKYYKNS